MIEKQLPAATRMRGDPRYARCGGWRCRRAIPVPDIESMPSRDASPLAGDDTLLANDELELEPCTTRHGPLHLI